ncbi:3' terminal RNA ribose 2'-O-methyltransferase Hen1 [Hymenobacter sp. UV11]|uniref:3' terminal RNA ribose 2'-O-methyltransferase Hen1 n=1 Tax=Hymenobacter sp. UV11 TaxID=1849735 RepID=UPI00105F132C|nr:3' terminal RNA ribose 2'-O-methyltransferase Hen1 [Hymenobacter sp. UV11]TDN37998.1 3' terminal RNA ribose 2'-O-methyltransferase Hen1 [Hymenobacter sp. UV11]TFZ65211.1 3' terminal RNA ribose 2'-O-methyltransferase Hen1 [Hymenobacter sp. UV11]
MLLTLTTTHQPATDLGYLLHKNPARLQSVEITGGQAHVFYPEATAERCTAALLLDLDPIGLVRGRGGAPGEGFALEQYVNDRPYVASSFLSVALSKAFGTAMNGTCKDRPALPAEALPLAVTVAVVSAPGPDWPRRLFEPLGYEVETTAYPLDPTQPAWGDSPYYTLHLRHDGLRLRDVLTHLYVLLPVLDNDKHYYVDQNEAEKLLHRGGDWLPRHPERGFITRRYLRYRALYVNPALARLLETDELPDDTSPPGPLSKKEGEPNASSMTGAPSFLERGSGGEVPLGGEVPTEGDQRLSLHDQRLQQVAHEIYQLAPKRVLDLGCGEGKLLRLLLRQPKIEYILGMDVSHQALARAAQRLHLAEMPPRQRARLDLIQGSLLYKDDRLAGFDAAALVEVIEHLDPSRLAALEAVVFGHARPAHVFVTTPNADYNQLYESLSAGTFRHADHRFEWSRAEFAAWATAVAARYGYQVRLVGLGEEVEGVGAPSQLAVFGLS